MMGGPRKTQAKPKKEEPIEEEKEKIKLNIYDEEEDGGKMPDLENVN
jgi:hypothetical protein